MLVDEQDFTVKAGNGGDGSVHFRREKYIAKGGPDGGDGGRGGDVIALTTNNISELYRWASKKKFVAQNGVRGKKREQTGKNGENLIISFPVGSVITNKDTGEVIELLKVGEKVTLAAGGNGGLGNVHYKSSRNTTPMIAKPGQKGQGYKLRVELNLIADVGIMGLPNVGKSTFLNLITNSSAKVGNYPFTTLEPNLGVAKGYIFADIPGIIEGASRGKGLGHKFLKHIRRTKFLLHFVPADSKDVVESYKTVRNELSEFDEKLSVKKEIIVLTKVDLISDEEVQEKVKKLKKFGDVFPISQEDKASIENLLNNLM